MTCVFLIFTTCEIILGIKLSRKFDKKFPKFVEEKNALENGWGILSPIFRGLRYAGCILFKNASSKRKYCKYFFEEYDFRKNASRIDWILILIVLSCFIFLGLFSATLYFINGGSFYRH
jgi:hypothetical protein